MIDGFLYHPQTEALLQWFSRQTSSNAFGGAYSYPGNNLTSASQRVRLHSRAEKQNKNTCARRHKNRRAFYFGRMLKKNKKRCSDLAGNIE